MTVTILSDDDVRDQFSAYVDPRFKEQKDYHEFGADFDAWLEAVKVAAEAKGREKAFNEVYSTLEGQEEFMGKMVEDEEKAGTPNAYVNSSYVSGISHALGAVKSARHLAELPEGLAAVAFAALPRKK